MALLCPGVGLVQRGFERFIGDLHASLEPFFDAHLYKGGGAPASGHHIPLFLPRNGRVLRILPLHWLIGRTRMHVECLTFSLAMVPPLRRQRFDLVHVIDPPLAKLLFHLRRRLGLSFRLLYTEGTAMPPKDYPPCDFIHQMSPNTYAEACAYGHSPERMEVLPSGLAVSRYRPAESREALRRRHGIAPSTFLVLCVAALNRHHKRIDYLVDEVSRMEGDVLLWLDGSMDHGDPDLPAEIRRRLGPRVRITRFPSDQVGELYRLCDVKVLPSLHEAYGLVLPEAMVAGAAVLAHDNAHFRWLVGGEGHLLDLSRPGALATRLSKLKEDPRALEALRRPEETARRFDWARLAETYAGLYRRVVNLPLDPLRTASRTGP